MCFTLRTESTTKTVITDGKMEESLLETGRIFIIVWIKNFTRKTNPVNCKGEISRCNFRRLKFYWEKNCPYAINRNKYDKKLSEQEHVVFLEDYFESLVKENVNMAFLDLA